MSKNYPKKQKEESKTQGESPYVVKKTTEKFQPQGFKSHWPHWSIEDIKEGLKMKEIFYGTFQIIEKRFAIICPYFRDKIWIHEFKTNRALNGSLVAFKILADNESNQKIEESKTIVVEKIINKVLKPPKNEYIDQCDYYFCDQQEIEELNTKFGGQKIQGEVVGILKEPIREEDLVGQIRFEPIKQSIPQEIQMNDVHKIYKIYFEAYQKQSQFEVIEFEKLLIQLGEQLKIQDTQELIAIIKDYNFIGRFTNWSRHSKLPFIKLDSVLNEGKNVDDFFQVQTTILKHSFNEYEPKDYEVQLNDQGKYTLSDQDKMGREDLTQLLIFTVDGPTTTDFDDALSIEALQDDTFLVGVHISDVDHFVAEGSKLDIEANRRSSTLYLTHKRIQMLPNLLSDICSLKPLEQRLTFSVFFKINSSGQLIQEYPTRVVKSIIRSCARLTYDDTNLIIEGKIDELSQLSEFSKYLSHKNIRICSSINFKQLFQNVCLMSKLADKLRLNRIDKGFLQVDRNSRTVHLNDNGQLCLQDPEQRSTSACMIEEYMVLTNHLVAKLIVQHNASSAIIIQQQVFQKSNVEYMQKLFITWQLEHLIELFDVTTSGTISNFLLQLPSDNPKNEAIKQLLYYKVRRNLQSSKVILLGSNDPNECGHYSLNLNFYTNFTSPIRRYQDILVHRLLQATLLPDKPLDLELLESKLNTNNQGKKVSKSISNEIERFYVGQYFQEHPTISDAYILEANSAQITIIIPEFDLDHKKFRNDMKGVTTFFDQKEQDFHVVFPQYEHEIVLKPLMKIQVRITGQNLRLPRILLIELIFKIKVDEEELIFYV